MMALAMLLNLLACAARARAATPPATPPANFSCAIGEAGFEFARHLQPERTNLSGVWDALVATKCKHAATAAPGASRRAWPHHQRPAADGQPGHGLWGWRAGVHELDRVAGPPACSLHVDPAAGQENGQGTAASPFRTITAAVAQVPAGRPCTIVLAAGTHPVHSTINIHPGLANLTIQPQLNATAVISGGMELSSLKWEPVVNQVPDGGYGGLGKAAGKRGPPPPPAPTVKVLRAKLPAAVGAVQLRELFSQLHGRMVPARTPDNPNANKPFSAKTGNAKVTALRRFGNATEVENSSWSRNLPFYSEGGGGGYFPLYRVGVGGPAEWFEPPVSYWAQPKVSGGQAATYQIPENISVDHLPGPRLADKGGGLVFSTHCKGWGGWVFEIGDVQHEQNSTNISFSKGGWQEARGCAGMGSFFVSHRLELLTQPGEWFHDAAEGFLYLGMPAGSTDIPTETLYGPLVKTIFSLQGTQAQPVVGFRVSGVIFRHVAPAYLDAYAVPSGGDYSLQKSGVVLLNHTEGCTVDHCLFDACGGNGVFLK
jgi:hypothetical protein